MAPHRTPFAALVVILLLAFAAPCLSRVSVGAELPEIVPKQSWNQDTKRERLSEYREEYVIVFLFATWCDTSKERAETLKQYHKDYGAKGIRIYAITEENKTKDENAHNAETTEKIEAWIKAKEIPFFVGMTRQGAIKRAFPWTGWPMFVVADTEAKILSIGHDIPTTAKLDEWVKSMVPTKLEGEIPESMKPAADAYAAREWGKALKLATAVGSRDGATKRESELYFQLRDYLKRLETKAKARADNLRWDRMFLDLQRHYETSTKRFADHEFGEVAAKALKEMAADEKTQKEIAALREFEEAKAKFDRARSDEAREEARKLLRELEQKHAGLRASELARATADVQ